MTQSINTLKAYILYVHVLKGLCVCVASAQL